MCILSKNKNKICAKRRCKKINMCYTYTCGNKLGCYFMNIADRHRRQYKGKGYVNAMLHIQECQGSKLCEGLVTCSSSVSLCGKREGTT